MITIGSKVMIRGDRRTSGKYHPSQLVDGKYVKRFGTDEPWIGVVRDINPWNGEALVGGGWRGLEMYELVQTENKQP